MYKRYINSIIIIIIHRIKSLFSGQVLLETIALSTGQNSVDSAIQRLNNEGFTETVFMRGKRKLYFFLIIIIVFARLGPIQLTREVTAKPFPLDFYWIRDKKLCVLIFFAG